MTGLSYTNGAPAFAPAAGGSPTMEADATGGAWWARARWDVRLPLVLLGLICVLSLTARLAWIGTPDRPIFDESYYVNAARVINGSRPPGGAIYATAPLGVDPNREHPPLAKVAIAGGIRLLGDRPLGWRAASLFLGTAAIIAVFGLVLAAGGSRWLGLGAASVMAVENLMFVHSSIAALDIAVVAFMLLGVALYLRGRPVLAGLALGVGACTKMIGFSALGVLVVLEVLRLALPRAQHGCAPERARPRLARPAAALAACSIAAAGSYLSVLWALDVRFTGFGSPVAHTRYMLDYAASLPDEPRAQPGVAPAATSRPWEWLVNREPILYHQRVTSPGPSRRTLVIVQGRMSPFVIYLAIPAFAVAVATALRRRDDLSFLVVAWCLATFLTFVVISLGHRFNYLYYMVVVLPGICLGIARLLASRWVPRAIMWLYGAGLLYGFWAMYPVRSWGAL